VRVEDHVFEGISLNVQCGNCCVVCGRPVDRVVTAYLLVAQTIPPRIAILRWNQTLTAREEARAACSPEHALEIVAHWMVSGLLDIHFTKPARHPQKNGPSSELRESATPVTAYSQPIGELLINRDSVRRLVASDPEALASVLDSLLEALQRDRSLPLNKKPAISTKAARRTGIA
jgi:hypothetical protein